MGRRFRTFVRPRKDVDPGPESEPRSTAPGEGTTDIGRQPSPAGPIKEDRSGGKDAPRVSERWLSQFYETVSDVLYILAVEPDDCFRFESVNHAFLRATGLTADQVVGKRIEDVLPPTAHALVIGKYKEAIRENKTVRWEEVSAYPTGTLYGLVAVTPVWSEGGTCPRLFGSVHDITEIRRAENALRVLSSRQEAILEAVPDILMEVDDNKIYTWANRAGLAFFGDDVVGKEAALYFEGEQHTYDEVAPLFSGADNVVYVESWQRRRDGEKRLLAWNCRALKEEHGRVTGAISSAHDITDIKKTRDEILKRERRFKQVADSVGDWIWEIDPSGLYTYASPKVENILGYTAEELVGKKHFYDLFSPDIMDELKAAALEAIARKEPFRELINPNVHKNGTTVILETSGTPVTDAAGNLVGYVGADKDVTQRKRAEEQIAMLRRFAEAASQGFGIATLDGRITYVNQALCRLVGAKRPDEMIGKNFGQYPDEESRRRVENEVIPAVLRDGNWAGELGVVNPQGEVRPTFESHFLIRDDLGRPASLAVVITDITERKRTDKALKEQLAELNRWHEAMLGRETRILQLKAEVNELLTKSGLPPRYGSADSNSR